MFGSVCGKTSLLSGALKELSVSSSLPRCLHLSNPAMAKVALVLSGCGVYDGSEVHEASACLVHLSRASASVSMFAPDVAQMHVVDHTKGAPMEGESRNVLVESARIARGKVAPLADLRAGDFDAVIFPGGFGAAKNLSDFAVKGPELTLIPDVDRVLTEFRGASKPIGLCCIAPVLAAKAFGAAGGVELTMGGEAEEGGKWPYAGATGAAKALGATHVPKDSADAAHVDCKNKVVTAPAYMCETAVHEIFDGIGKMVGEVLKLA